MEIKSQPNNVRKVANPIKKCSVDPSQIIKTKQLWKQREENRWKILTVTAVAKIVNRKT